MAVNLDDLIGKLDLETKVRLLTGATFFTLHGEPTIGLAPMALSDGPTGVRGLQFAGGRTTSLLPNATLLAAAWSTDTAHEVGVLLAEEAQRQQIHVVLGPTINLHRSPLGGRLFEAYSEDPLLTGLLAAAYVRGLQEHGIGACLKHLVANEAETDRHTVNSTVDERTLREVYLLPFEIAVTDADPWSVMAAYNDVNGLPATEQDDVNNGILKGEWAWTGLLMSDWFATQTAAPAANGGLDLVMPGPDGPWGPALVAAVETGAVEVSVVDDHVRRLLRLADRVGALGEHAQLAHRRARAGRRRTPRAAAPPRRVGHDRAHQRRHAPPRPRLADRPRRPARPRDHLHGGRVGPGPCPAPDQHRRGHDGAARRRRQRARRGGGAHPAPCRGAVPGDRPGHRHPGDADPGVRRGRRVAQGRALRRGAGPRRAGRRPAGARAPRRAVGDRARRCHARRRARGRRLDRPGRRDRGDHVTADGDRATSANRCSGHRAGTPTSSSPSRPTSPPRSSCRGSVPSHWSPNRRRRPTTLRSRPPPRPPRDADVAVVVVGLTEEQETEAIDKTTLALPGRQDDLVFAVAAAAAADGGRDQRGDAGADAVARRGGRRAVGGDPRPGGRSRGRRRAAQRDRARRAAGHLVPRRRRGHPGLGGHPHRGRAGVRRGPVPRLPRPRRGAGSRARVLVRPRTGVRRVVVRSGHRRRAARSPWRSPTPRPSTPARWCRSTTTRSRTASRSAWPGGRPSAWPPGRPSRCR